MKGKDRIRQRIADMLDQSLVLMALDLLADKPDIRDWSEADHVTFLEGKAAEKRLGRPQRQTGGWRRAD
jgi:hypothetical protein